MPGGVPQSLLCPGPESCAGDKKSRGTREPRAPALGVLRRRAAKHSLMRCSCCPEGRVRGHAGTSGWNGLGGQRVRGTAAPPTLLWQLERSLIIAALTMMSNHKENCLANLLEGSAGGRSWLREAKCLPASPRAGLRLRCRISLVPAAGVQKPIKDGEGKAGVMEADWGRARGQSR